MENYAVITGSSKGIGFSIAKKFATEGFSVIISSRNTVQLMEAASALSSLTKVYTICCDFETKQGLQFFIEETKKITNSKISILVNNAGTFTPGKIIDEKEGVFEKLLNLNVSSHYHITRGLFKSIVSPGGHIFNISSIAGLKPYDNGGSYCISKFAMTGFSKMLREELKPYKIAVTTIYPGATLTESWSGTEHSEKRFINPDDIADSIYAAYLIRERSVVEEIVIRPMEGDI